MITYINIKQLLHFMMNSDNRFTFIDNGLDVYWYLLMFTDISSQILWFSDKSWRFLIKYLYFCLHSLSFGALTRSVRVVVGSITSLVGLYHRLQHRCLHGLLQRLTASLLSALAMSPVTPPYTKWCHDVYKDRLHGLLQRPAYTTLQHLTYTTLHGLLQRPVNTCLHGLLQPLVTSMRFHGLRRSQLHHLQHWVIGRL